MNQAEVLYVSLGEGLCVYVLGKKVIVGAGLQPTDSRYGWRHECI